MDQLWAPWRMEYIRVAAEAGGDCLFCPMAAGGDDRVRFILHRGVYNFVVLNRYPYNPGHCMVVPYAHVAAMESLPSGAGDELVRLAGHAVRIARSVMRAEGANCGVNLGRVAGAGVIGHVLWHVVPRWAGDTNFLPVLGATKSMPEYLAETYDRLRPHFASLT